VGSDCCGGSRRRGEPSSDSQSSRLSLKWRYLSKLALLQPLIVFLRRRTRRELSTLGAERGRVIIPYGIAEIFRRTALPPRRRPPLAIFTSNPLRSLDWAARHLGARIRPLVRPPSCMSSRPGTYGALGAARRKQRCFPCSRAHAPWAAAGSCCASRSPKPPRRDNAGDAGLPLSRRRGGDLLRLGRRGPRRWAYLRSSRTSVACGTHHRWCHRRDRAR